MNLFPFLFRVAVSVVTVLVVHNASAQTAQPVVWVNVTNAVTTGLNNNGLQKNGGCAGCADAGANSQQRVTGGNGYIEFTAAETTTNRFIGLSTIGTHDYRQIHWSWKLGSGGIAEVREDNIYQTETTYVTNDVFRVAVVSGAVQYSKNGNVLYTSALPPSYPLYADASLLDPSASFSNAMFGGSFGDSGPAVTYDAISDRNVYTKPALTILGPRGFRFTDPVFGSEMLRITDANTLAETNLSYRSPSGSPTRAWNASSTRFWVTSTRGTIIPYAFDAASMTATRMSGAGDGGLILTFNTEPFFSRINPDLIYGGWTRNVDEAVFREYNFATGYATIFGVRDLVPTVDNNGRTYLGGMGSGSPDGVTEYIAVSFGGTSQDLHRYIVWWPAGNFAARKLLDTVASTINGVPLGTSLGWTIHAAFTDQSGRYVMITKQGDSVLWSWDTTAGTVVRLPNNAAGHGAAGYASLVNNPNNEDVMEFRYRELATPTVDRQLISPYPSPQYSGFTHSHTNWSNAVSTALTPAIVGVYRYNNNPQVWREWDDEIIAIRTDGVESRVWRFAHHRSDVNCLQAVPACPGEIDPFWYTPRANASPDGRWLIFTSNWEKTLGSDPVVPNFRQDVFLVKLVPSQ